MNGSGNSNIDDWSQINSARAEGRLFSYLKWPSDPELRPYQTTAFTSDHQGISCGRSKKSGSLSETGVLYKLSVHAPLARPVSEMLSFRSLPRFLLKLADE